MTETGTLAAEGGRSAALRLDTPAMLSGEDIRAALDWDSCIAAVRDAFVVHAQGRADPPGILGFHVAGGGFHVKVGAMNADGHPWFVAKCNANFPGNPARNGLPTIQGALLLFDASDGRLMAVMSSIELTIRRTAAATAVAVAALARSDSRVVALAGCGAQGRAHLHALTRVMSVERLLLHDRDPAHSHALAAEADAEYGIEADVVSDFAGAARQSDVCVTCTPATAPLFEATDIRPGTLVCGVGADSEHKQELPPALFANSRVVVDVLDQCMDIGDLHHAIAAGVITADRVHAELGEVLCGMRPGRIAEDDIVVFDSTGMALQDAAAAILVAGRTAARTDRSAEP